jgi:hypothetical protein
MEIATDTAAFDALTELVGQPFPTGTQGEAEIDSILSELPPDAQSFFRSLTAAEADILASILNSGVTVSGSSASAATVASASATPTTATTASGNPLKSSEPSLTQTVPSTLSASSSAQITTTMETTLAGSTLATLAGSSPTTNNSTSPLTTPAVVTKNVGVLLRSGGLGLVLVILGASIAAL